jgi:hypothetical protein
MTSQQVRSQLVETVALDLVGPPNDPGHPYAHELLPQSPQRWYLTGYLVPNESVQETKDEGQDDLFGETTGAGGDDNDEPDKEARLSYLPSSVGLTCLVPPVSSSVEVVVRWGDYHLEKEGEDEADDEAIDREYEESLVKEDAEPQTGLELQQEDGKGVCKVKRPRRGYRRECREESVTVAFESKDGVKELRVNGGLTIVASWRVLEAMPGTSGLRTLSVFVINNRSAAGRLTYKQIPFQVELEIGCSEGFHGRADLRGATAGELADADERIADLQYRDVLEYAVGHGISAQSRHDADGICRSVSTTWLPLAEVPRVDHADEKTIGQVTLGMEGLAELKALEEARSALSALVASYRAWITTQETRSKDFNLNSDQKATAGDLLATAKTAADRIEEGIESLADPLCLEAFRIANRAMARSTRQRFGVQKGVAPEDVEPPRWRAFQLAFILMNLKGLADPLHPSRQAVDLLFFPTGGGKTEAYLGLAAFTLVLRRLKNPGISSAGVSIIMRYTLRLLTLDQLGRAAGLMCALELERASNAALGDWPFEIGLWVGSAATPNRMGRANDDGPGKDDTAWAKLTRYRNKPGKFPAPIPLEECPWCGTRFTVDSFNVDPPGSNQPRDLRVSCVNDHCEFSSAVNKSLPVLGVDEPIYRRLPCFLIATVDKFAALPWTGKVGALFGRVERYDHHGFYGPCDPNLGSALPQPSLLPPDLIIQDELHLISGPLGTVAGIYETAIETLCRRKLGEKAEIVPKIVASTATVRRADRQIRALFGRQETAIFPPPGPDRDDSFFARTIPATMQDPGRLYLGVAAQGRSMKVVLLRSALALLAGAESLYDKAGGKLPKNPCDPYMTLLGYFNSLRELGGSRRIIEDEVYMQAKSRWKRRRLDPVEEIFRSRNISRTPVELTSRVSTNDVADARRRLALEFTTTDRVDVALATNMISVGLDIVRLGLMVVLGQPKTTSEYIQSTSRVGRDKDRPGLVVTLLNVHRPRDRSHYERFGIYHRTFYRSVEATSVTPFSPRALDRALAAALVGLCRHALPEMESPVRAGNIGNHLPELQEIVRVFAQRARIHDVDKASTQEGLDLEAKVDSLAQQLLSQWIALASKARNQGGSLTYQKYEGQTGADALVRDFLDPDITQGDPLYRVFRANRSMRDVEAAVDILDIPSTIATNQ